MDIVQKVPGGESTLTAVAALRECMSDPPILSASSDVPCLIVLPKEQTTTTVVFFLGGCTYTEIAALRWVERQNKGEF